MQLLPLGLVDEQLAGLGALKGADDAPLLHLIHQTGGTGIAQLQAALEHGDGCLSRFQNHLHGSGQQLVAVLLCLGGFGRGLSSAALFLLLQMCPPRFYAVKYLFSFTACSILSMTSREYSASPVVLTKPTTRSISSGVMKQPCTRVGFPAPSGA